MSKYNHMFDIAFTVESGYEDPNDVLKEEFPRVIKALQERIREVNTDTETSPLEVFWHCDSYEIQGR